MRFSVALQFGVALIRSGTAWAVAGEAALGVRLRVESRDAFRVAVGKAVGRRIVILVVGYYVLARRGTLLSYDARIIRRKVHKIRFMAHSLSARSIQWRSY